MSIAQTTAAFEVNATSHPRKHRGFGVSLALVAAAFVLIAASIVFPALLMPAPINADMLYVGP